MHYVEVRKRSEGERLNPCFVLIAPFDVLIKNTELLLGPHYL